MLSERMRLPWRIGVCLVLTGILLCFGSSAGSMVNGAEGPESIEREIQDLQTNNKRWSSDPLALTYLAGLYLDLGNERGREEARRIAAFEEGARLAHQAIELRENLANAHFYYAANLGSAAQLKGLVASALNIFELKAHVRRTLELQADHAPALHMMGMMLEELPWFLGGDSDEAVGYLEKAVASKKDYMQARLDLAKLYLKREMKDEAIQQLRVVVRQRPSSKIQAWAERYRPEAKELLQQIESQKLPS